jgi:hypothetical protein
MRTYRLFFVSNSEDALTRLRTAQEYADAARRLRVAGERRAKWVETANSGREAPADV